MNHIVAVVDLTDPIQSTQHYVTADGLEEAVKVALPDDYDDIIGEIEFPDGDELFAVIPLGESIVTVSFVDAL